MNRFDFYLQWIATFLTVLGALFTAGNMYPENVVAFNLGSALWLWWAIRIRSKSLITVNFLMLAIYVGGAIKLAL